MDYEDLMNPVVRTVVEAMHRSDRESFFAAFAPDAVLTDDGNPRPFEAWADREIFRNHGRLDPDMQEEEGLHLAGQFHSDQWGTFLTSWKFDIHDGKVTRLDVAAE